MTSFDDRKNAFENKHKHDEEQQFKAIARRNKLVALWAAEKMGKNAADAEAYAKHIVAFDLEKAGDDDVCEKLLADLNASGQGVSKADVRFEMDRFLQIAAEQIKN